MMGIPATAEISEAAQINEAAATFVGWAENETTATLAGAKQ